MKNEQKKWIRFSDLRRRQNDLFKAYNDAPEVKNYADFEIEINWFYRLKTLLDNLEVLSEKTFVSQDIFSEKTFRVITTIMRRKDKITLYSLSLQSKYRFGKYPICDEFVLTEIDSILDLVGLKMLD